MAMPRKSLSEHALQNTKPAYVEPEAFVPAGRPKYPRGISGEAKAAFKRLARMLEARRSITPGDEEILRLYAFLFSRHQRALAAIEKEGEVRLYTRLNNHGEEVLSEKPNLWLKVAETCEAKMIACLSALGMTPMNRSKVRTTEPKPATPQLPEPFPSREEAAPVTDAEIDLSTIHEEQIQ
jgi:P27 family predicted phage terminase small subunit